MAEQRCVDPGSALRAYHQKIRDKINGGYRVVEMNYDDDNKGE
jgi:hypothetical protein